MMNETLRANQALEPGEPPTSLRVLGMAIVFGWTVGLLMGLGARVALAGYLAR